MQFEVLGPLQIRDEHGTPSLTAPLLRTLLATLLCRANTPVSVDLLIDILWSGAPVQNARQKLQVHLHRLRQSLDDQGRIGREHSSYTLRVRPGELDAERFETLLAAGSHATQTGDHRRSAELIREALDVWRGEPYSDLGDVPLLREEAARLVERRLVAYEDLYSAELACGGHTAIVAELKVLVDRNPLRERLQELLVLALYRSGRTADAVAAYRQARQVLVEELGLEPGPRLAGLHAAMLAADPALEAPAADPPALAQLPTGIADFTGRSRQVAAVCDLASGDPAERPDAVVIVAVAGKPGVGKTTLAIHAAHRLKPTYPDGQLYVDLRGAEATPLDPRDVLARFLRALGVPGPTLPDTLDERAALYRSRLAGRRVLVLLDNAAGEAQVRPLLPGTAECAVLVTSRVRPAGLEAASHVDLDLFDPGHAIELLARVAGPRRVSAEAAAAEQIARLCGYLPLAVRIAGARLAARPHWPLSRLASLLGDEHRRLDQLRLGDLAVRASLSLSYHELEPVARQAFRRLGMLEAPDFAPWVAAALLDRPADDAENIVDRLVDAQLLEVAGHDGAGRLRYHFHDLVRLYARELAGVEEPDSERSAALGRAFDGLLALTTRATAHRSGGGEAPGEPDPAVGWTPDEYTAKALLHDPAAWLELERPLLVSAVEQAAATGQDTVAWMLTRTMRPFLDVRGYLDDWRRTHETGLAAARRLGDRRAEGTMLHGLARLAQIHDRYDDSMAALEQAEAAFGAVDDRHGEAGVRFRIGATYRSMGRGEEARRYLDEAAHTYRALGDPHGEAEVLQEIGATYLDDQEPTVARSYLERSLEVFRDLGHRRGEALGLRWLGAADLRENALGSAESLLLESASIFDELNDRHNAAFVLRDLAAVRSGQGRLPDAEALLTRSLDVFCEYGDRHGEARALHDIGLLHHASSRPDAAIACLQQALLIWQQLGVVGWQAKTLRSLEEAYAAVGLDQR